MPTPDDLARRTDALVAAALAAIEDDAPSFAVHLAAIADAPAVLGCLAREPERGAALFVELRKLRPVTLWVRDTARAALDAKRTLGLDGALCRPEPSAPIPPAQGRECWLELAAAPTASELAALPPGFGLCVRAPLTESALAALRRSARLRAIGLLAHADTDVPPAGLDLLVLPAAHPLPDGVGPARVLWLGPAPGDVDGAPLLLDYMPASSGVVCTASQALSWALALASRRRPRAGTPQALVGEAAIVKGSGQERGNGPRS